MLCNWAGLKKHFNLRETHERRGLTQLICIDEADTIQ